MGVKNGIVRSKLVIATLGTILALSGVALGMVFAQARGQLWGGLILVAGFIIAWHLFDAILWSSLRLYLRFSIFFAIPAIICFTFAIVYITKEDRGFIGLLGSGLIFLAAGIVTICLGWILSGFATKEQTESKE